ncbi:MAG: DegT/DnrJ/EryC1/StrS family aminotransferase [Cyclobacteriaceae bacterium]|nr:DegT/DnrJ/EryC1/StrS family aminotransferase [Cyclobacteriaceae bacterium]
MEVLFNDLKKLHQSIPELNEVIQRTVSDFNFIRGKQVTQFEESFKAVLGVNHCVTTGNGTDALFIALRSLGINPGDEVITPAFSWISSSETISLCGAKPVFADVDSQTYTLDPDRIEEKITDRTKAIVAVHLYGQAAHLEILKKICDKHHLFLIEDCAQGHLTLEYGKYAGTVGEIGAFSFYPTKNLGAYGDAGCIVTNSDTLAEKARRFANHGALLKDDHLVEGMNSRMDTLQAAVLLAKLPHLKRWNEMRNLNAQLYDQLLDGIAEIILPLQRPDASHTFHLYVIRAQQRDELKRWLANYGIQTLVHYPQALPDLPAYHYLGHDKGAFPVAGMLAKEVLSLPVHPLLHLDAIQYVADRIRGFYKK